MSPSPRSEFKGISTRASTLLARDENLDVDFKESLAVLEADDFVQFANSPTGGTLLIGVREIKNQKGQQRGEIRGVQISDKNKQIIVNKASSCVPPISIEIYAENVSRTPFYRVEIPTGTLKALLH